MFPSMRHQPLNFSSPSDSLQTPEETLTKLLEKAPPKYTTDSLNKRKIQGKKLVDSGKKKTAFRSIMAFVDLTDKNPPTSLFFFFLSPSFPAVPLFCPLLLHLLLAVLIQGPMINKQLFY